jgi:hypothetical protein
MREGAEEGLGSRACSTAGEDYLSFWISGVPQYGELIATSMSKTQRGMSILGNRGIFLLSVAPNGRCERDKSYHERKAVENCIHPRVLYAPIEFQRMEVYGTVSNLGGFERVIRQAVPKSLLSGRPLPITVQQPRLPPECTDYEFFSLIYRYTYYEIRPPYEKAKISSGVPVLSQLQ